MHIAVIPSKQGTKIYKSKLLRKSYRKNGKVQKQTLANLSSLDDRAIALLKGHLKGKTFVETNSDFNILQSRHHGHVAAVKTAFQELDFTRLIDHVKETSSAPWSQTHHQTTHQTRNIPMVAQLNTARMLWYRRNQRRRTLQSNGLAAAPTKPNEACQAPVPRGRARAVRPEFDLP